MDVINIIKSLLCRIFNPGVGDDGGDTASSSPSNGAGFLSVSLR